MSSTTQNQASKEMWLPILAMNDAVFPETVARISGCSKTMRSFLAPFLELKTRNKAEMHAVILRRFPGIKDLPDPSEQPDASLYNSLLGSYFNPSPGRLSRLHLFITIQRLGEAFRNGTAASMDELHCAICMFDELRSAKGRSILLEAIAGWRSVVHQTASNELMRRINLMHIDRFERIVRHDFAVRYGGIGSEHQYFVV